MSGAEQHIQARLFALQDVSYRDFQCRLMPTVPAQRVIGVRMPALRQLAREIKGTPEAETLLRQLPHAYYEEDNLHGLLIEQIKDYALAVEALNAFLPYVDNWATCDLLNPRAFRSRPPELPQQCRMWMESGEVYSVRFGIGVLMRHYLEETFQPDYLAWVAAADSEEYYISMMVAWYFATALAKQKEGTLPYLQHRQLSRQTHNRAIQKAVESFRLSGEEKAYLKTLRWR
jgi:3-methyladenine DNA glycosylase AlkD